MTALSRQAESYKHSAQRPANALTEKQHELKLVEMDAKRYGLAKTVADLEQAIASSEMALSRSKAEVQRSEREDPTEGSEEQLSIAYVTSSLYRSTRISKLMYLAICLSHS